MGSGADRQLRVYERTKSYEKVVEYIHSETTMGLMEDATGYISNLHLPSQDALDEKLTSLTPTKLV